MFKWLTRKDGAKIERAKRRLKSPRGSVFTEFALVVPILVLICSALIEIVGFWDAQVMANHAAWTVGRIVMVRGSNGLAFSKALDQKSKTGIAGSDMPDALKQALADLDKYIQGFNKFNNRGNIATMFLMSTCGIGYFGKSPGNTINEMFKDLCTAGVKALTEGIPGWIENAISGIKFPSLGGGGDFLEQFVQDMLNKLLDAVMNAILTPLTEALKALMEAAFEKLMDWLDIDHFFDGTGDAAYMARHLYGAASRIGRAKDRTGQEVLVVTDMEDAKNNAYVFAKVSDLKRLAYPQCVDSDSSSDGYFVSNPSGWPPNDNALGMVHVEINWPYESGWLFPVVSGYGTASKSPVAKGHSMVFQQPNIANENLYSDGATKYDPGTYKDRTLPKELEDLANEMKAYLKCVKFCMQYRICEEKVTLHDGDWSWESWTDWKDCPELMAVFGVKSIPAGGDYAKTWENLTGTSSQRPTWNSIKDRFETEYYHSHKYFYWDGWTHGRYSSDLCSKGGDSNLGLWYDQQIYYCYMSSGRNMFSMSAKKFNKIRDKYKSDLKNLSKDLVKKNKLYDKVKDFANGNLVNVRNIAKWQEGFNFSEWVSQDKDVHQKAKLADGSFKVLVNFIHDELAEIDDIINGTAQYTGSPEDPVLDPEDEGMVKDPESAATKAREKWETMKENLRKKLKEVESAASALNSAWSDYKSKADKFMEERAKCPNDYFAEACIRTMIWKKDAGILDSNRAGSFRLSAGSMPYDIGAWTRDMLAMVERYQRMVNAAYDREVEYGLLLGLERAGAAKREGKSPDQVVDEGGSIDPDKPGSLSPGSDKDESIEKDKQEYNGGKWNWK